MLIVPVRLAIEEIESSGVSFDSEEGCGMWGLGRLGFATG